MARQLTFKRMAEAQVTVGSGGSVSLGWTTDLADKLAKQLAVAQETLDRRVLEACEPYIPRETGALIASGRAEDGGVCWQSSYAAVQYYGTPESWPGAGLRGGRWFERMMADRGDDIVQQVKAKGGGR